MAEKQKESWEDFEKRLGNVKIPNFVKVLEDLEKKVKQILGMKFETFYLALLNFQ